VTTPSYSELVAAVRREGEGIVSAGGVELDLAVPTCGDWRMGDLLVHVGRVYHRAGELVGERVTGQRDYPAAPPEGTDPRAYVRDGLDELVEALSSADAETPVWNWSSEPQIAGFWARRMAHESAVHRYDAQRAQGLAQPIDDELAHDGMDELVDVLLPRIVERDGPELAEAVYAFSTADEGEWVLRTGPDGIERLPTAKGADVTVRGPASAVLLAAYGRVKWASLDVAGDESLLPRWSESFRF
jgi:uncharacterized protein (TIGR03083 family)